MAELALTMPKMSMTMEEGTMVSWLKQVGDPIKSGEPVCEVATDKVDMEVESPFDGVLARITAEINDVIKVGDPIAYITTDADDLLGGLFDEPAAEAAASTGDEPLSQGGGEGTGAEDASPAAASSTGWIAAVPRARALASERGVDLATVTPTGPWNTVRVVDLEGAKEPTRVPAATSDRPAEAQVAPQEVPVVAPREATAASRDPQDERRRRTRMAVAKAMSRSAAVPQFTAYLELDLEAAAAVRKTDLGGASWTSILVKAQALALLRFPQLNAFWTDDGPVENSEIGIALAVDSPAGLLAPVLHNPDSMPLSELGRVMKDLVEKVRQGSATAEQLSGGTTVFSNLGGFGVRSFNALLTPPHATALSAGQVSKRMVVLEGDAFAPRLGCTVGLTVDHRVADGADAARYLTAVKEIVENPQSLLSR
jgi:pyruvate dehydrogenase E2 component (dihydrolipoamide acetyltransferase)